MLALYHAFAVAYVASTVVVDVSGFGSLFQARSEVQVANKMPVSNSNKLYATSSTGLIDNSETLDTTDKGLLKRDRYVATNRFAVRKGQQAKFEKRWATRKSRLATLPGFQYFHLMRRVVFNTNGECTYDEGINDKAAQENYVSFTIWNKKSDFSAWRSGEAFKEAHGGTSITAFLSTMVNSALILRGAPRPAFYDGLLIQKSSQPQFQPEMIDGWRNVEADGITTLPAECFVELVKYYIPPGKEAKSFEQKLTARKDQSSVHGFVASTLLRRDGQAKG